MHVAPVPSMSQSFSPSFCSWSLSPHLAPGHPSATLPSLPASSPQPLTTQHQRPWPPGALSSLSAPSPPRLPHSPAVLDILVDEPGDEHGHQGVVPGADEHEGQAQAHAQEGECPGQWEGGPASEPWGGLSLLPRLRQQDLGGTGPGPAQETMSRSRGTRATMPMSTRGLCHLLNE